MLAEHGRRLGLVVDRVERGDDVVLLGFTELRDIAHRERGVGQSPRGGLSAGRLDGLFGEVVADKAAGRELPGQDVDRVPRAAAHIGDRRAGGQPLAQTGHDRHDEVEQPSVVGGLAVGGHHRMEARERLVADASTGTEAPDHVLLDFGEQGDVLHHPGQVVGPRRGGQAHRVLGRQPVRTGLRVVLDNATGGQPVQPLAHVALVQSGRRRELGARRGRPPVEYVEQADLMADAQQQGQG